MPEPTIEAGWAALPPGEGGQALVGLTVLECSSGVAGAYCGWLLAAYGARVILAEPPEGSALRARGPFAAPEQPRETGALFLTLAAGKESVVLPAGDAAAFERLCAAADVLVTDEPGLLPMPLAQIQKRFPHLVLAALTPFGLTGPYASFAALPGALYALGGYSYMTGDPAREPLQGPEHIPGYMLGLNGYIGVLAALMARRDIGAGQLVDVSATESLAAAHQWTITRYSYNGRVQPRNNTRYDSLHPVCFYPCADGVVAVSPSTPDQLERMLALIGRSDLLEDPRFATNFARITNADAFDAELAPWFLSHTRAEIAASCQEFRVPVAPAFEVDELLEHEQLRARGFWRTSEHPVAGAIELPAPPFRMPLTPSPGPGRAPLLGEHSTADLPMEARFAVTATPRGPRPARPPLESVRILDLTRVWSGPLATRVLGDLGAEVIKIEHPAARGPANVGKPDPVRASFYPDLDAGDEPWNRNAAFNKLNRNKKSVAIDLATPEGREVFHRLARKADVVIENYSPRVMGNLGLGFETLTRINPRLTLVSMPGYGLDGPLREGVAYGSTLDAESGVASLMGYEGEGPQRLGVALPDPVAGLHAASAVLTALIHRKNSGSGQHIDLSQLESMACFVGEAATAYQLTGERRARPGNRHAEFAPHGVFPCSEPDAWVFVGVATDPQWHALRGLLAHAGLEVPPFNSAATRKEREQDIEVAVRAWTRVRTPREAMLALQAVGVPSGAVLTAEGLFHDPHLRERGFLVSLKHPVIGRHDYPGQPIHLSATPPVFHADAPRLGEHNAAVLAEAGYSPDEVAALLAAGVIAHRPPV